MCEFLAYLYTGELYVCLQMTGEGTRCPGTGVVDGYVGARNGNQVFHTSSKGS